MMMQQKKKKQLKMQRKKKNNKVFTLLLLISSSVLYGMVLNMNTVSATEIRSLAPRESGSRKRRFQNTWIDPSRDPNKRKNRNDQTSSTTSTQDPNAMDFDYWDDYSWSTTTDYPDPDPDKDGFVDAQHCYDLWPKSVQELCLCQNVLGNSYAHCHSEYMLKKHQEVASENACNSLDLLERDFCLCINIDMKDYITCDQEYRENAYHYHQNETALIESTYVDEDECFSYDRPKEVNLCLCISVDRRPYVECNEEYEVDMRYENAHEQELLQQELDYLEEKDRTEPRIPLGWVGTCIYMFLCFYMSIVFICFYMNTY